MNIYLEASLDDEARRSALYQGDIFVYNPINATRDFIAFTKYMIDEAFDGLSPITAQHHLAVTEYVEILARLKPHFINHLESKHHLARIITSMGCDPLKTYFDVPRVRTSTSDDYLVSGISYTYHAHRDTWYAAPMCQQNWWMPVFPVEPGNCMAIHPSYFSKSIANDSDQYDYSQWVNNQRKEAVKHVYKDTRAQPHASEPIDHICEKRIVIEPGASILFSAAHLHSSVPNNTGKTRFSIDFRTVNLDDLIAGMGAPNVDSKSWGTNLGDYFRVSDFEKIPEEIVERYAVINHEKNGLVATGK